MNMEKSKETMMEGWSGRIEGMLDIDAWGGTYIGDGGSSTMTYALPQNFVAPEKPEGWD